MQKYFLKLIIMSLVTIFLHSFSSAQTTLAILDFEGRNISQGEALTLTDRFRNEIIKTNKYIVVERGAMEEILEEQGFQQTGCTSNECVVEVGQLLGVQQMISGSIGKVGDIFTVSVRIIDIRTGEIINVIDYDHSGDLGKLLTVGMRMTAQRLVGIKGGTFEMGSNDGDSDEKPIHTVTVSDSHEVTQEELEEIKVVPSPFIVNSPYANDGIHFTKLPQVCRITIYTVAGKLVKTIDHYDQYRGDTNEDWDLTNEHNQEVAHGLYIYVVESGDKKHIGKFAIVR